MAKSDWITNGVFAALCTATFYVIQLQLEQALPRYVALPISVIASAVGIGVVLRYAVTALPLRWSLIRNRFLRGATLEGLWLEVLDRRGERHYSIVRFQYDAESHVDRFSMIGNSYFPTGKKHSGWETRYVRVRKKTNGLSVEYIYGVKRPNQAGRPRKGYGESWFTACPARPDVPSNGEGYYLASEEKDPFRCSYDLHRIDDLFKQRVGASDESLETQESEESFVQAVDLFFREKDAGTPGSEEYEAASKVLKGI